MKAGPPRAAALSWAGVADLSRRVCVVRGGASLYPGLALGQKCGVPPEEKCSGVTNQAAVASKVPLPTLESLAQLEALQAYYEVPWSVTSAKARGDG